MSLAEKRGLVSVHLDLLLVNKMFGAKLSGEYSIATQFSDLLRSMAGLISGVLGPVMMILYARGEYQKMASLTNSFVKCLSLSIAIPICIICVYSDQLISIWVGAEFSHLSKLVWIVTFPLIINLGVLPIFSINVAMKKIQIPSVMNVGLAILGFITSFFLIKFTSFGYYAIAVGFGMALTIKNAFFIPVYAAKIMKLPKVTFIRVRITTILFSAIYMSVLFILKANYHFNGIGFFALLIFLSISGLFFSLLFYNNNERSEVLSLLKRQR